MKGMSTQCTTHNTAVTKYKAADMESMHSFIAQWENASCRIICLSKVCENSFFSLSLCLSVHKRIRKVCKDVLQSGDNLSRDEGGDQKETLAVFGKFLFPPQKWKH